MVVNKRKTHLRHLAQARQKGNAHNAANMPSSDSESDIEAQSYIDNDLDGSDIEQQLSRTQNETNGGGMLAVAEFPRTSLRSWRKRACCKSGYHWDMCGVQCFVGG